MNGKEQKNMKDLNFDNFSELQIKWGRKEALKKCEL